VLSAFCFQAVFASVLPGEIMRGSIGQMIQFPSWLGKNSTAAKNDRLSQELCQHMRLQYVITHLSLFFLFRCLFGCVRYVPQADMVFT